MVLGTEGDGLAVETIADCDYTVMIPMAHGVDSLNVAGGISGGLLGAGEKIRRWGDDRNGTERGDPSL